MAQSTNWFLWLTIRYLAAGWTLKLQGKTRLELAKQKFNSNSTEKSLEYQVSKRSWKSLLYHANEGVKGSIVLEGGVKDIFLFFWGVCSKPLCPLLCRSEPWEELVLLWKLLPSAPPTSFWVFYQGSTKGKAALEFLNKAILRIQILANSFISQRWVRVGFGPGWRYLNSLGTCHSSQWICVAEN